MKKLIITLLRLYQATISPIFNGLGTGCRFYPSCSAYGMDAIEKHGWMAGTVLMFARLMKCHPFHPGGFDPVPEKNPLKPREFNGRFISSVPPAVGKVLNP